MAGRVTTPSISDSDEVAENIVEPHDDHGEDKNEQIKNSDDDEFPCGIALINDNT